MRALQLRELALEGQKRALAGQCDIVYTVSPRTLLDVRGDWHAPTLQAGRTRGRPPQ